MKRFVIAAAVSLAVIAGAADARGIQIPFEVATRHIILKVTINKSRPLSFVLDTGADTAIVRTDVAKELGLKLEGSLNVGGAGAGAQAGSFVRDARWSLVGLEGFSQPVAMTIPMPELPIGMGRDVDGIIGGQFIREFVLGLDYQTKTMTIYNPASFSYTGAGQAVPIDFVSNTHPTLAGTVTTADGRALDGRFVFDIGSGGTLVLHSPFVARHNLPGAESKTIRAIGGAGAGGQTTGRQGRVEALRFGSFSFTRPFAMFSADKAGAFANAELAGNIGAQIAMRFRLFLDYSRKRIIFEPNSAYADPWDRAFSGVALRALGTDFRTFRVLAVLEDSPGSEAGIREGDVITAIDGRPAAELTISIINDLFEKPATYTLTIRRGDQMLKVALTPRKII